MAVSEGVSCYICLDEGSNEAGKPLVRNCSCSGNMAGFTHISCIIEYAKQKSKHTADSDLTGFSTPWLKCNNCNQDFQNQLSLELSSAFVLFAKGLQVATLLRVVPLVLSLRHPLLLCHCLSWPLSSLPIGPRCLVGGRLMFCGGASGGRDEDGHHDWLCVER